MSSLIPGRIALFVTEGAFIDPSNSGGVARCSTEYIALLEAVGLQVVPHIVTATRAVVPRVKAKVGIEAYELYGAPLASGILDRLEETGASLVALNQVYFLPVAHELRRLRPDIRIVVLSHGNESGDFLHEALRTERSSWQRRLDQARLGLMIHREGEGFQNVDAVLCLSETERHINLWLGAPEVVTVPRTWSPHFLDWTPVAGRVGFVGALNHLPNTEGVGRVLDALDSMEAGGVEVRIVGGGGGGEKLVERFAGSTYLGRLSDAELVKEASTWSLFLNPVWWHARGASTKLAQAIEWGIPIATSPAGMRGYEWGDGELLVTETPEAMAAAVIRIASEPELASGIADSVRRVAQSAPSLEEIAERIRPTLLGHLDQPPAPILWPENVRREQ